MTPRRFGRLMLDLRYRETGGAVASGNFCWPDAPYGTLSADEADALRGDTMGREVVILLHGFNVDRSSGQASLGEMMRVISPDLDGRLLLAVLWPGDSVVHALSYPFEGKDADDSAAVLTTQIGLNFHKSARISFVAHSKGCRVAMRTIQLMGRRAGMPSVGQVCLMAAAMDRTCLTDSSMRGFSPATERTARIAILSSVNDLVLALAYPAGDLLQGWLYAETDEPGLALGWRGPKDAARANIRAREKLYHQPTPVDRNVRHGDYLPDGPGMKLSSAKRAAANFAIATVSGAGNPRYG